MVIINLYKNFIEYGGAEKVAIDVHYGLTELGYECYLMGGNSFESNNSKYNIEKKQYKKFSALNAFNLKNTTIISHHRKNTTILFFLNKLLRLNIRLIHVAHNEFDNLKFFSYYPKEIITVSQRVKDNLVSFFNVNPNNITVIYNGLADLYDQLRDTNLSTDKIKILYAARITKVKGQVELVNNLKGKLNNNIQIDFAGTGEDDLELQAITKEDKNFNCLGFTNLSNEFYKYNYVMLFSSNEGLPLTLIESCSFKTPVICNDIGGNVEIIDDAVNGFVVNDYSSLLDLINNKLPEINPESYATMSDNARATFEKKFLKIKMIENYKEYIEKGKHVF